MLRLVEFGIICWLFASVRIRGSRRSSCAMPDASELQLPAPSALLLDESCELRSTATSSPARIPSSKSAARPSMALSSNMSVLSNEDIESTFSSLRRSVAAREEREQQQRSRSSQEVMSENSYVVVTGASQDVPKRAQTPLVGSLATGPSPRPQSILAVLDECNDTDKLQNTESWVQNLLAQSRSENPDAEEAGSTNLSTDLREPAVSALPEVDCLARKQCSYLCYELAEAVDLSIASARCSPDSRYKRYHVDTYGGCEPVHRPYCSHFCICARGNASKLAHHSIGTSSGSRSIFRVFER